MGKKTILGKVTITLCGEYVPGTAYDRLDAVSNDGSSYISRVDENTAPLTDTDAWMVSAKKGEKGDPFTFGNFTPEQLASLKGDKGDPFRFADFTDDQIDDLKKPATDAAAEAGAAAVVARNLPKIIDGIWWLYDVDQKKYVATTFPATGKSPKIQGGTWWVWDDAGQQYIDSHVSVSSDYQLTKEAVENVLTGNIGSHNHSAQLADTLANYVLKVAGKQLSTEDFTTAFKNKLDGLANYNDAAVRQSISDINSRIDTLLGGSASSAIDTFHEIETFLQGITDTKSLAGLMNDLKTEITGLIPTKQSQLENDDHTVKDAEYVHTDNNYSTAEKTKLAKVHDVPTLDHEPGETDLSFTDVEGVHQFKIGDLVRFWDAGKNDGEYVFFQLNDITNNKAVWKLSGSGGDFTLPGETLIVTLDTNQTNAAQELIGAVVKLTHSGEELVARFGVARTADNG